MGGSKGFILGASGRSARDPLAPWRASRRRAACGSEEAK